MFLEKAVEISRSMTVGELQRKMYSAKVLEYDLEIKTKPVSCIPSIRSETKPALFV